METPDTTLTPASLPAFARELFDHLPRADQRRWAHIYLEGLLNTPGKKSVRRIAETVSGSPTAPQSLQQFVNASPWDWMPVREQLARWVERRLLPRALVIDQVILRKRGQHSCGVHRRYLTSTGRSVTCQVGVGAFLASDDAAVPVNWSLFLPRAWTEDPIRRARTRIPETARARPFASHALELAGHAARRARSRPLPVVADLEGTPGASDLIGRLDGSGREFVVSVPGKLRIVPGSVRMAHCPVTPSFLGPVLPAYSLHERDPGFQVHTEEVPLPAHLGAGTVTSCLVHVPETGPGAAMRTYRLLVVRNTAKGCPAQLWLTNMLETSTKDVLDLAALLPRTARAVRDMEKQVGLLDFEGRSYPGWHHHMTLVSAAYAHRLLSSVVPWGGGHPLPRERMLVTCAGAEP
ncbi:IS701 family transposase (plasmid) [Streptomyces sp. NBC_00523]|uniref:IS701 family transposase n=1 Tax=Streptomyces sp. NBC_00523 TaxID=2975765 RepID=UPI002E80EFC9|nr:IS701 family transposase [Streptomyces sp. NBC_00523]WUD04581.1 IS701 family transposase [Streptomyces sp. NBC_00523]